MIQSPEHSVPEKEPGIKTQEVTIKDSQGFDHEAELVRPENESGLHAAVLMVGGIPPGSHNTDKRPLAFHPFYAVMGGALAKHNAYAMEMNPRGMGHSEGDTWDESLQSRLDSLVDAAKWLTENTNTNQIRLIGSSMGGHLVLRLAEKLEQSGITVDRLALLSPAAYSQQAEQVTYREGYKNLPATSTEESPAMTALERFNGRVLLLFAENDKPIPLDVQAAFEARVAPMVEAGRATSFKVKGVEHMFKVDNQLHEPTAAAVATTVAEFLTND